MFNHYVDTLVKTYFGGGGGGLYSELYSFLIFTCMSYFAIMTIHVNYSVVGCFQTWDINLKNTCIRNVNKRRTNFFSTI